MAMTGMSANTDGTPLALTAAAAPELASNRKRRPPLSFQFPKSGCPGSKHDATIVQMVDDGHSWADIEAVAGEAAFDRYYCMLDPDLAEFWTLDAITTLNTTVRELAGPSSFAYNVGYVDDIQPLDDGLPWDAIAKKIKSTVGQCSHVWRTFGDGRPASEEARAEAAEKMRQKKLKEEKECDRLSAEEERVGQAKKQEKVFLAAEKERKRVAKEMEQARLAKKHERQARATEAVEAAEKLRLRRIKVEGEANARAAEARKALLGRRKVRKEYRQRTTSADSRSHSPESSWNTHMPIGRDKSPNPTLSDLTPTPGSPTRILADMRENERRVPRWARVPARSQVVTMEAGHAQKLQGLKVLVQNLVHKEQHKRQQRKQDLATFMDSVRASRHWRSAQMQEEEEEQKQLEALSNTPSTRPTSLPPANASIRESQSLALGPITKRPRTDADHISFFATIPESQPTDTLLNNQITTKASTQPITPPSIFPLSQSTRNARSPSVSEKQTTPLLPNSRPVTRQVSRPQPKPDSQRESCTSFPAVTGTKRIFPFPISTRTHLQLQQESHPVMISAAMSKDEVHSQHPKWPLPSGQPFPLLPKRPTWPIQSSEPKPPAWTAEDVIKMFDMRQQVGDDWEVISVQALGGKHSPQECRALVLGK